MEKIVAFLNGAYWLLVVKRHQWAPLNTTILYVHNVASQFCFSFKGVIMVINYR